MSAPGRLGFWTGLGLEVGAMIGIGVFVSAAFMVQDLGPGWVLGAWVIGAGIAMAGARAYAALATIVPASGGEYRYLSDLVHPALGFVAGWASLVAGFAGPVALDSLGAVAYLQTLWPGAPARALGISAIVLLTLAHALGVRSGKWTQNALVAIKVALLVGFVALGLVYGKTTWPTWQAPRAASGVPLPALMTSLFFIAYAFSGWDSAVYVASEFKRPRQVPGIMLIGCAAVALIYLAINWIFVANLPPERALLATDEGRRVTLGHLVVADLVGPAGARAMSVFMVLSFLSAMSTLIFLGANVAAVMARDGYLPRALAGTPGRPSFVALALQALVAIAIMLTHGMQEVLGSMGGILTLFSALSALALFRVRFFLHDRPRPPVGALVAAFLYAASGGFMLYYGYRGGIRLATWTVGIVGVGLAAWMLQRFAGHRSSRNP